jgi:hypothetical protein
MLMTLHKVLFERMNSMKQNTVRIFLGVGFGCFAVAVLLGWVVDQLTQASLINNTAFDIRNPPSYGNLLSIGAALGLMCAVLFVAMAFVGALARLSQLRQWGWFAILLVLTVFVFPLGIVAFIMYLVIGPDTPATGPNPSSAAS